MAMTRIIVATELRYVLTRGGSSYPPSSGSRGQFMCKQGGRVCGDVDLLFPHDLSNLYP